MSFLTKTKGETTYYAYAKVLVADKQILAIEWHTTDQLDKTVLASKGAYNEIQLLKIPPTGYDTVKYIKCVRSVVGQDSEGNDLYEYSIQADNVSKANDQMIRLRVTRDRLLKESDWTQLSDVPFDALTKHNWAVYRQALRDLPEDPELDLDNIIWPTKPS